MPLDPYFNGKKKIPAWRKHADMIHRFQALSGSEKGRAIDELFAKRNRGELMTEEDNALFTFNAIRRRSWHNLNRERQHIKLRNQQSSSAPQVVSRTYNTGSR